MRLQRWVRLLASVIYCAVVGVSSVTIGQLLWESIGPVLAVVVAGSVAVAAGVLYEDRTSEWWGGAG
jgi:hypothetical protein